MGEAQLEDALRIQRERVARRTAAVERQLVAVAPGRPLQTARPLPDQIDMHAPTLVAHLRVIVETWRWCDGPVPQPLSVAVMEAKRAIAEAAATEACE